MTTKSFTIFVLFVFVQKFVTIYADNNFVKVSDSSVVNNFANVGDSTNSGVANNSRVANNSSIINNVVNASTNYSVANNVANVGESANSSSVITSTNVNDSTNYKTNDVERGNSCNIPSDLHWTVAVVIIICVSCLTFATARWFFAAGHGRMICVVRPTAQVQISAENQVEIQMDRM
jgi:hypothetical protein